MKLHPFDKCVADAFKIMKKGSAIYQQFNCMHCGTKQTMADANKFYTRGICEECGKETDIKRNGCNYMVAFGRM